MFAGKNSILYFLLGCIPIRILIAALPTIIDHNYLPYFGFLLLMPAIGFLTLYFSNLRLTANEAGGKTWWAEFRLIHGLLYLCAAIYALQSKMIAWIPLVIDVVFGFLSFITHHYTNKDFAKLV